MSVTSSMDNILSAQYEEWGSGDEVIVLLHYFGGAAKSWTWVANELSDFKCIALNIPGFGGTQPLDELSIENFSNWIINTLVGIGVERCILVGHSMSAKFAMKAKQLDSDNIFEKIILVAPSPPSHEPMSSKEKEEMLEHPNPKQAISMVSDAVKLKLTSEQQELAQQTPLLAEHGTWQWWINTGMNQDIRGTLSEVDVEYFVLASEEDPIIPIAQIREELGDAKVIITHPTSGHLLPFEDPKWLAGQIKAIHDKYINH